MSDPIPDLEPKPEAQDARHAALALAHHLAQPPEHFAAREAVELFATLIEGRDRRAERVLGEIEESEATVTDHRGGGPGATLRARNAVRDGLARAVELADQAGREVDQVRDDDGLSDAGRQRRIEAILTAHRDAVEREVGAKFKLALDNLDERESALRRGFASATPEPGDAMQAVADRLDLLAVLHAAGRSGDAVEAAVLSYAARGDRRAGLAMEAAAWGLRDPLRVRALAMRVRGMEAERRRAALLADEARLKATAELHLIATTRQRVENQQRMLKGQPSEAALLLANWR